MIHTTTNHHEQGIALLPALGSAVTFIVCWIKIRADERKAKNNNTTNQTTDKNHHEN